MEMTAAAFTIDVQPVKGSENTVSLGPAFAIWFTTADSKLAHTWHGVALQESAECLGKCLVNAGKAGTSMESLNKHCQPRQLHRVCRRSRAAIAPQTPCLSVPYIFTAGNWASHCRCGKEHCQDSDEDLHPCLASLQTHMTQLSSSF